MIQKIIIICIFICMSGKAICQVDIDTNATINKDPVNMTVAEFNSRTGIKNKIVLVNFKADWCVVCKKQKPILEEIKVLEKEVLEILVIDMADNPLIAAYFEVDGLPITLIFKSGTMVWGHTGLLQRNEILDAIRAVDQTQKK